MTSIDGAFYVPRMTTELPPLNKEMSSILGTVCFVAAPIARRLHALKIYDVKTHAEEEQATFIHWALGLYFKHGDKWREVGEKILKGNVE